QKGKIRFAVSGKANQGDDDEGNEVAEDEDGFGFHQQNVGATHASPLQETTLLSATRGTTALRGWNAYPSIASPAGPHPCRSRRWEACRSAWHADSLHPGGASLRHRRRNRAPSPGSAVPDRGDHLTR